MDGIWLVERSRQEIAADLKHHDFDKWTKKLYEAEDITDTATWLFVFDGDRFAGYSLYPDGSWRVGWRGPLPVDGNEVSLVDEEFQVTDTFRYAIEGDELTLKYLRSEGTVLVKGIPEEVYLRAYFTAPLKRTTCPPEAEPCHA